jgi:hypothetical protein
MAASWRVKTLQAKRREKPAPRGTDAQGARMSLYLVVENFKNEDAVPVYRRYRERGRLASAGLFYVSSWVSDKLDRCYQLMETEDRALLDQWIANWSDIIDFEVHPVITSKEAAEKIAPRL